MLSGRPLTFPRRGVAFAKQMTDEGAFGDGGRGFFAFGSE